MDVSSDQPRMVTLGYIISHGFFNAKYGEMLRELVSECGYRRTKATPSLSAGAQNGLRRAVREVVAVLDARDRDYVQHEFELPDPDVGEADVVHLALFPQHRKRPHRVLEGDVLVGGVKLLEVYTLEAEAPQRPLACLAQVLGAASGT
jgi:hypothetical protein